MRQFDIYWSDLTESKKESMLKEGFCYRLTSKVIPYR